MHNRNYAPLQWHTTTLELPQNVKSNSLLHAFILKEDLIRDKDDKTVGRQLGAFALCKL